MEKAFTQRTDEASLRGLIESELQTVVSDLKATPKLNEAIKHMLFPGGKRLRPLLALSLAFDLGGKVEYALEPSISLELLHTSTLIHDDLPAMDNDDFRRGKPTCHKVFGESTAILAGDYLLGAAIKVVTECGFLKAEVRERLVRELAGTYLALCNGQQLDILPTAERGDLLEIHRLKTGALFSSTMKFGAILADSEASVIETAGRLGGEIGLAFQLIDDIKDASVGVPGRGVGSDKRNNKATFSTNLCSDQNGGKEILNRCKARIEREIATLGQLSGCSLKEGISYGIIKEIISGMDHL